MNQKKACHIVLTGRVQGVGFRYFARKKALELNLCGWVRNKTDGSVDLEIEGDEDIIQLYIDLLRAGNGLSRVDRLFKTELPGIQEYTSFFVRY